MKKGILILTMIFSISFMSCDTIDKGVWQGDFYLKNNTDMQNIMRYSSVAGDLIIQPQLFDDPIGEFILLPHTEEGKAISPMLTLTLKSLSNLTQIGGSLIIRYTDFVTLDGLENIHTIGKDLIIERNSMMMQLYGLSSLTSVGGSVIINKNNLLSALGMDQLENIGADLRFSNNLFLPVSEMENLRDQVGEENIGGEIVFE